MTAGEGRSADPTDPMTALTRLRNPATQRADPKTRWLLEAGLDAISASFKEPRATSDLPLRVVWPTQERVVARYREHREPRATRGVLEHRWRTMSDYYCDLFTWSLHPGQYAAHRGMAQHAAPEVVGAADLAAAARAIARAELEDVFARPLFRMKLLICVMDPVAPVFRDALARFYAAATEWWSEAYRAILAAANLELRGEIGLGTFAALMTAMEEGLALRYAARPEEFGNSIENLADSLALGAMALINGSTAEPGQTTTLAELLRNRFGGVGTHDGTGPGREGGGLPEQG
ncbi:hypothetical protein [Streptomyces sp. NRRL S-87]|uniref:hypothetical protein n=1 Tax=Streptomyces sp. NRRL S-87 TaxID=1463920 RepID=UPI00131D7B85|nr:hypothetical protein [Streptomyces sp. NRRL S-87]